jgi:soluble lytic murein transglycosylase-like protein
MTAGALLVCLLAAQDPYQRARELMEAAAARQREAVHAAAESALARQRAAVQAQVRSAAQQPHSFFTTPWSEPLAATPAIADAAPACEPVPEEQLGPLVEEIAQREGLTPDLLRAVIEKESSRLPCAISPKGAQGLMQLMPSTAAELGVEDPFDPAENVAAGARLLRRLLARYGGDLALALGAYNAGPAWIDAFGALPPFRETLDYVSAILGTLRRARSEPRPPR